MPNHVSNILKFVKSEGGKNYKEVEIAWTHFKEMMTTDKSEFDFNELAPYPEAWAKLDEAAHKARENGDWKVKDGYNSGGYEWCVENWGTKWNAYEVVWADYYEGVSFQTAWSTPQPIFELIAKRFPEMEIRIEYADEDTGSNCGILIYKDGKYSFTDMSTRSGGDVYFARAIQAEQCLAEYSADYRQQIERLKKELAELRATLAEKQ